MVGRSEPHVEGETPSLVGRQVEDAPKGPTQAPQRMSLGDIASQAETARIALRRRFEDLSFGSWADGASETQESVAG